MSTIEIISAVDVIMSTLESIMSDLERIISTAKITALTVDVCFKEYKV